MSKLTQRERRVLRYHGQPAATVAVLERIPVAEVLRIRLALRSRGVAGISPFAEETQTQLDLDRVMRENRGPRTPGA